MVNPVGVVNPVRTKGSYVASPWLPLVVNKPPVTLLTEMERDGMVRAKVPDHAAGVRVTSCCSFAVALPVTVLVTVAVTVLPKFVHVFCAT